MTLTLERPMVDPFVAQDFYEFLDQQPPCERQIEPCHNPAVYRVKWGPADPVEGREDLCRNTSLICLPCYELFTGKTDGLVACGKCYKETGIAYFKRIVYSELIR